MTWVVRGMILKQTHDTHGVAVEDLKDLEAVVPFFGGIEMEQIRVE